MQQPPMPYARQQQYAPPQPPQVLHAPPNPRLLVYNARPHLHYTHMHTPLKTKGSGRL